MSAVRLWAATDVTNLEYGFDLGVHAGLTVGFQQGWSAHVEQVQARFGLAVLDAPTQDEMARRRVVDHKQCASRCRSNGRPLCSRCIHAWAYFERGNRDYLGVEGEQLLLQRRGVEAEHLPLLDGEHHHLLDAA